MSKSPDLLRSMLIAFCLVLQVQASKPIPILADRNSAPAAIDSRWQNEDTIRICAIRIEFQPDNLTGTSGNGLMGDSTIFPRSLVFDRLPHDRQYFADHLAFVRNYYAEVSGQQLRFAEPSVFPADESVLRLNNPMWHYNYNTDQELLNEKLVELFVHAIQKADSAGVPLDDYNAFVIFHAGVGKDFSLGYDATPFDIPSAYISETDLDAYNGQIPAAVTRGIILPESEQQQEALDFDIELSLNGISVKLFGNWLGMPDLFDTETGRSGIGRWGVMDQGSGNVNALVPAAPDAWTRVYMGWYEPELVIPNADTDTIRITHSVARFGSGGASEILKLPITTDEYFLVENRDSDADSVLHVSLFDRIGREMQIDYDGNISIEQGFEVAVRASHYDFGIPGSGILVWRVNEAIIRAKIESNRVNADRENRGVELVEADGAQDIGREYGFATPGSGTELGIQEDAWWRDNRDHRAANGGGVVRFTDRSHPSTRTRDGAYTYLELTAFSDVSEVMTFRVRNTIALPGYPVQLSDTLISWCVADLFGVEIRNLILQTSDSIFVFDSAAVSIARFSAPLGVRIQDGFLQATDITGDGREEVLFQGDQIGILAYEGDSLVVRWTEVLAGDCIRLIGARTSDEIPMLVMNRYYPETGYDHLIQLLNWDLSVVEVLDSAHYYEIINVESQPTQSVAITDGLTSLTSYEIAAAGLSARWTDQTAASNVSVVAEPSRRSIYVGPCSEVFPTDATPSCGSYVDAATGEVICSGDDCGSWPRIDWDGDGIPEGGGPFGYQSSHTEDLPQINASTIVYSDVDANGTPDILALTPPLQSNGTESNLRLSAVRHAGGNFDGMPVAMGTIIPEWLGEVDVTSRDNQLNFLTSYHEDGSYYYVLSRIPVAATSAPRFKFQEPSSIINVGPLRQQLHDREDWVYCWPNPAKQVSYIRITRSVPSSATVKIFDLAGRQVADLSGESNVAGAFEIPWLLGDTQSGVYIGSVEVTGGGASERSEIKIAVVK